MICLIRPPAVEWFRFTSTSITLPLGLAYIAGALEASGRKVSVIDAVGEGPDVFTRYYKGHLIGLRLPDIVARIPAEAKWVGITAIFTHEWPEVVRLVDLIKEARPDLIVVLGGEHITSMPEICLMTSKADALVLGEGEETVVELAEALETGRPLYQIDGLAFRDQDRVVVNKRRRRTRDVDSIPRPAWDHFKIKTYHDHRYTGGMHSRALTVPILATRGCPYQCTYCSAPNMWTPQWIPRDPGKVVDEIEHYVHKYGAGNFPWEQRRADPLTARVENDVLRVEGLLEYAPALAARIDAGVEVARDSEEEVEIRACGLHAVELLVARRSAAGRPATAQQLDQLLWNRGQSPRIKAVPRHRTRTTFY